jgi:Ca2+-binding RTX toxin-like protein
VAEDGDSYTISGVNNVATDNRFLFDSAATNRVTMNGFQGNDFLNGGGGNDTLNGDEGADTLIGGNGADELNAGFAFSVDDGADSLNGGNGADRLTQIGLGDIADAGAGNDVVNLDEAGFVSLLGGAGIDILVSDSFDLSGATVTGFERLWNNATLASAQVAQFTQVGASTIGGAGFYSYTFATATNAVDLTGRIADDFDTFTLNGSALLNNNDTILFDIARSNNVTMNGLGGNDSLRAGEGDDSLAGGEGNDTLDGGFGLNTIDGGNGTDAVSFESSALGVTVNLSLVGAQQNNAFAFNNLVSIEAAIGSNGNDTLTGSNGNNTLTGGSGADSLLGLGGADQIFGGAGDDTVNGGFGNDQLTGGDGVDRFLFNPSGGTDTVFDYVDGVDRIAVSGYGAAFDTAAEVRAAAIQAVGGVQINLTGTTILISGLALASFTAADIDVV